MRFLFRAAVWVAWVSVVARAVERGVHDGLVDAFEHANRPGV